MRRFAEAAARLNARCSGGLCLEWGAYDTQREVLARQQDIASGKLHPFYARLAVLDNDGKVVIAKGQTLSDAQTLGMNWLAQGVQAKLL